MKFRELLGFRSKEQMAQEAREVEEQEKGNRIEEIKRKTAALKKHKEDVQENVRMFSSAPADNQLLTGLDEQIAGLEKELAELKKPRLEIVTEGPGRSKIEHENDRSKLELVRPTKEKKKNGEENRNRD